jgi:hypothetical protein
MPDLDGWLDFWIEVRQNRTLMNETQKPFLFLPFNCYRPINLQTHFTNGMTGIEDLQRHFFAFGITSEMTKSSCLIATCFFGQVPTSCNCSNVANKNRHNLSRVDHNVKNHGDSYNLTDSQRQKIASLTDRDQVLWRNAKVVFQQQIDHVEAEYNVRLCDEE